MKRTFKGQWVPAQHLKSRTEFATDAEYQAYYNKLFKDLKMEDFLYTVNVADGRVYQGDELKK